MKKIIKPLRKQNKLVDDYKIKFPELRKVDPLIDEPGFKIDLNQLKLNEKQSYFIENLGNDNEFYHFFINLYDFVLKEIINITNTNLDDKDNDVDARKEKKEFLLKNDKFIRKIFNRIWLNYIQNIKGKIFEFLFEKNKHNKNFNIKNEEEKKKDKNELVELIENFYKKMVFNKIYESFLSKNENELKKENKKDKWMKDWKEFLTKKEKEKDVTDTEYEEKKSNSYTKSRHSYFYIEDITTQTPSNEQQTKIQQIDQKVSDTTTVPNNDVITSTITNIYKIINKDNDEKHKKDINIEDNDLMPEKNEDIKNFATESDQIVSDTATLSNSDLITPTITINYQNITKNDYDRNKEDIDLIKKKNEGTTNFATESVIKKPEKEYFHKLKNVKEFTDFTTTTTPDEQHSHFIDPYVNPPSTVQSKLINTHLEKNDLVNKDNEDILIIQNDILKTDKEKDTLEIFNSQKQHHESDDFFAKNERRKELTTNLEDIINDQEKGEDRAVLNSDNEQQYQTQQEQYREVLVKDSFKNNKEVSDLSEDILNDNKRLETDKIKPEKYHNIENVKDKIAKKNKSEKNEFDQNLNQKYTNKDIIIVPGKKDPNIFNLDEYTKDTLKRKENEDIINTSEDITIHREEKKEIKDFLSTDQDKDEIAIIGDQNDTDGIINISELNEKELSNISDEIQVKNILNKKLEDQIQTKDTTTSDIINPVQDDTWLPILNKENEDNLKKISDNYGKRKKDGIVPHKDFNKLEDILNSEDLNNEDLEIIKEEIENLKNQDLVKDIYKVEKDILEKKNKEEGLFENIDKEDHNLNIINEMNNKDLEKIKEEIEKIKNQDLENKKEGLLENVSNEGDNLDNINDNKYEKNFEFYEKEREIQNYENKPLIKDERRTESDLVSPDKNKYILSTNDNELNDVVKNHQIEEIMNENNEEIKTEKGLKENDMNDYQTINQPDSEDRQTVSVIENLPLINEESSMSPFKFIPSITIPDESNKEINETLENIESKNLLKELNHENLNENNQPESIMHEKNQDQQEYISIIDNDNNNNNIIITTLNSLSQFPEGVDVFVSRAITNIYEPTTSIIPLIEEKENDKIENIVTCDENIGLCRNKEEIDHLEGNGLNINDIYKKEDKGDKIEIKEIERLEDGVLEIKENYNDNESITAETMKDLENKQVEFTIQAEEPVKYMHNDVTKNEEEIEKKEHILNLNTNNLDGLNTVDNEQTTSYPIYNENIINQMHFQISSSELKSSNLEPVIENNEIELTTLNSIIEIPKEANEKKVITEEIQNVELSSNVNSFEEKDSFILKENRKNIDDHKIDYNIKEFVIEPSEGDILNKSRDNFENEATLEEKEDRGLNLKKQNFKEENNNYNIHMFTPQIDEQSEDNINDSQKALINSTTLGPFVVQNEVNDDLKIKEEERNRNNYEQLPELVDSFTFLTDHQNLDNLHIISNPITNKVNKYRNNDYDLPELTTVENVYQNEDNKKDERQYDLPINIDTFTLKNEDDKINQLQNDEKELKRFDFQSPVPKKIRNDKVIEESTVPNIEDNINESFTIINSESIPTLINENHYENEAISSVDTKIENEKITKSLMDDYLSDLLRNIRVNLDDYNKKYEHHIDINKNDQEENRNNSEFLPEVIDFFTPRTEYQNEDNIFDHKEDLIQNEKPLTIDTFIVQNEDIFNDYIENITQNEKSINIDTSTFQNEDNINDYKEDMTQNSKPININTFTVQTEDIINDYKEDITQNPQEITFETFTAQNEDNISDGNKEINQYQILNENTEKKPRVSNVENNTNEYINTESISNCEKESISSKDERNYNENNSVIFLINDNQNEKTNIEQKIKLEENFNKKEFRIDGNDKDITKTLNEDNLSDLHRDIRINIDDYVQKKENHHTDGDKIDKKSEKCDAKEKVSVCNCSSDCQPSIIVIDDLKDIFQKYLYNVQNNETKFPKSKLSDDSAKILNIFEKENEKEENKGSIMKFSKQKDNNFENLLLSKIKTLVANENDKYYTKQKQEEIYEDMEDHFHQYATKKFDLVKTFIQWLRDFTMERYFQTSTRHIVKNKN